METINLIKHNTLANLSIAGIFATSLFTFNSAYSADGADLIELDRGQSASTLKLENNQGDLKNSDLIENEDLQDFLNQQIKKDATVAELKVYDQYGNIMESTKVKLDQKAEGSNALTWLGIIACLSASAALSGMNIGLMSLNRLELEVLANNGDKDAQKLLNLRKDGNTVLATILWANVGVNSMLTLLSDSALAGAAGFAFSVAGLTLLGEIVPQAYFSKNALKFGGKLTPFIHAVKFALYPIAKPTGIMLDNLVGKEYCKFFGEEELHEILDFHKQHEDNEISAIEAQGASNFLRLDDTYLKDEGEVVSQSSIIKSVDENGEFVSPVFKHDINDPFIQKVRDSKVPWVVIVDGNNQPRYVLDADGFLIESAYQPEVNRVQNHWHKPVIISDEKRTLGETMKLLKVEAKNSEDDVIDDDVILLWNKDHQRIITGADILGRLLRGIV